MLRVKCFQPKDILRENILAVWLLGPKFSGEIFPAGNRQKQEQNSEITFRTSKLGEKSPREKTGNPPGFV
jgi:hypothetical protein